MSISGPAVTDTEIEGNVIGGTTFGLNVSQATGTVVAGNWIGTNSYGDNLGNSRAGVVLEGGTTATQVGGPGLSSNTIAFNGWEGVLVVGLSTGNSIRGNSIYSNGLLGIDLSGFDAVPFFPGDGVTLNGSHAGQPGPNDWQTFPVLSAAFAGASTVVLGTLNSTPSSTFTIDFYANAAPDPTGYGEGQTYLGSTTVTTDASGNASFTATGLAPAGLGQWISATATSPTGDTSEFCQDVQVVQALTTTTLSASNNPSVYGQAATFTSTVASDSSALGTPTGSVQFVVDGSNFGAPVTLVNGAATSPAIDSLGAGNHTITAVYSGDTNFVTSTAANLTQVVNPAPLTVADNQTNLYGNAVVLSPTYTGFAPGQNATNAGITGAPTLSTTATATSDVGIYPITVGVGTLSAPNYSFAAVNGTLTVNPQTLVSATYTGLLYVATASATTSTATVTLSATVKDLSGGAGTITDATVTFVNRADGSVIAVNLPVSLISSTDPTTGTASYNWIVNIGSANSQSYTIGIIVGYDYSRNGSADNAVVTVSKPQAGSATGGGYLVNQSAAGLVPGDAGAKTNFGFNAKNNSGGLQGQTNLIVRYQGHVYQYQTGSITSLTFPSGNTDDYAGTGTIEDVTNPSSTVTLYTGATLQVTMADNGHGASDTIGVSVWTPAGALWFSSDWNGTKTVEQALGGGTLQVRAAQELAGAPASGVTAVAPLTLDEIGPIAAAAIARWAGAGVGAQQLAALSRATFQIDNLGGSDLAWKRQGVITLDPTADGYGWFIDPTPSSDSEFAPGVVNSPASGHVDLLSVVAHELGHLLGYGEDDSNGVTGEYLARGLRHVPVAAVPAPGAESSPQTIVKVATSTLQSHSLAKPQGSAALRTTDASDGLMALVPAAFGRPMSRTATNRARVPHANISGPGLPDRSRRISAGPIGQALDAGPVDSLLDSTRVSLLGTDGRVALVKKSMERFAT